MSRYKLLCSLAVIIFVLQIIDGLTTYIVLSGSPDREDKNPVAALVFQQFGLGSGVSMVKIVSILAALYVLLRVKRNDPGSMRLGLFCLSVCAVLMTVVAVNNMVHVFLTATG